MATSERANELKAQGALEAARDPNSHVTPQAAEDALLDEARKGGSAAYKFDPNASPEEKAAQAKAVRDQFEVAFRERVLTVIACAKELPPRAKTECRCSGLRCCK
jgi:hypothetical protein